MCARVHLDPREFACVHTHKCKRSFLRACSRVGLIETQNAFACKKSQNSNALCVHKLSECVLYEYSLLHGVCCAVPAAIVLKA